MLYGFPFIREMTKEELIEELAAEQRRILEEEDIDTLKQYVIQTRTRACQRSLIAEAALEPGGPSGLLGIGDNHSV